MSTGQSGLTNLLVETVFSSCIKLTVNYVRVFRDMARDLEMRPAWISRKALTPTVSVLGRGKGGRGKMEAEERQEGV